MAATRPSDWVKITALAATQHALITTRQVADLGIPVSTARDAVADGVLEQVRRGVLGIPGAPRTPRRAIAAACLAAGGDVVASHLSAAELWGFGAVGTGALEVTRLVHGRLRLDGVRVHSSGHLVATDVAKVDGIPVTSPIRTSLDLAGCLSEYLLARFIDHVRRAHGCPIEDFKLELSLLGGRGRPGTRIFRELVNERAEGLGAGDNDAEVRIARKLVRLGLPRPVHHHAVDVGPRTYVLDLAWPPARAALELDGFDPHATSRTVFDGDKERDLRLRRAGWDIVHVSTKTDLRLVADYLLPRLRRSDVE